MTAAPQNDREFQVWEHGRRQGHQEAKRTGGNMYELFASIKARLPDDQLEQAAAAQRMTGAWAAFLEALKGIDVESCLTIGPVLEAPVRRRRGRPRRDDERQPRLAMTEPPAAA